MHETHLYHCYFIMAQKVSLESYLGQIIGILGDLETGLAVAKKKLIDLQIKAEPVEEINLMTPKEEAELDETPSFENPNECMGVCDGCDYSLDRCKCARTCGYIHMDPDFERMCKEGKCYKIEKCTSCTFDVYHCTCK